MNRIATVTSIAALLVALSACGESPAEIEKAAMLEMIPDKQECTKGVKPPEMKPNAYLAFVKCMNSRVEAKIMNRVVYPDLMAKLLYTAQENAALYAKGEITYDQVEARRMIADADYSTAVNNRLQGDRAIQATADSSMIQSMNTFAPKAPVHTHCTGSGYSVNCTSY